MAKTKHQLTSLHQLYPPPDDTPTLATPFETEGFLDGRAEEPTDRRTDGLTDRRTVGPTDTLTDGLNILRINKSIS